MRRVVAVLALVLLQGCSRPSDEAALTGGWVASYSRYASIDDLTLEPDRTFSTTLYPLALHCRFPDSLSETRATGRWTFDREKLRIDLDYDPPALTKCKLPTLRTIVVDPSGGETDLLLYPSGVGHLADRTRLMRPRRAPPNRPASTPRTQVDCFRAQGQWKKWCEPNTYRCYLPFRDAGKRCTDSSQCEGLCLVDTTAICEPGKRCVDAVIPETGQPFAGRCQKDDASCGDFIEIHKGRAEPVWSVD